MSWLLSPSPISVSLSRCRPNLATHIFFSFFVSPCILPKLSFSSFYLLSVLLLWTHPIGHPRSFFQFFSLPMPLLRESDMMQRAVDWKRAAGEGGSEASCGSKVSLQQDRGGLGGRHRLCFSLSPPFRTTQDRATPKQQIYYSRSC